MIIQNLFIIAFPVSPLFFKYVIRGPLAEVEGSYLTSGREALWVGDVSRNSWKTWSFAMEADLLPGWLWGQSKTPGSQREMFLDNDKMASLGGLEGAKLRAQWRAVSLRGVPAWSSLASAPGLGFFLHGCSSFILWLLIFTYAGGSLLLLARVSFCLLSFPFPLCLPNWQGLESRCSWGLLDCARPCSSN